MASSARKLAPTMFMALFVIFASTLLLPASSNGAFTPGDKNPPARVQMQPGFGGVFFAEASGSIDLTFGSGPDNGTTVPIPTLDGSALVLLYLMVGLLGAGAVVLRRPG